MKFTELSLHIHGLRHQRSGRSIGAAMRLVEVCDAAIHSDLNDISQVHYYHIDLVDDMMGNFCRLINRDTGRQIALVFVNKRMPKHWQEFVAIKETMHCWSPRDSYVAGPGDVGKLLSGHIGKVGSYSITPVIAADVNAITAAAEVMLPAATILPLMNMGLDYAEIAHRHGLHPDIVAEISKVEILHARLNGSL